MDKTWGSRVLPTISRSHSLAFPLGMMTPATVQLLPLSLLLYLCTYSFSLCLHEIPNYFAIKFEFPSSPTWFVSDFDNATNLEEKPPKFRKMPLWSYQLQLMNPSSIADHCCSVLPILLFVQLYCKVEMIYLFRVRDTLYFCRGLMVLLSCFSKTRNLLVDWFAV